MSPSLETEFLGVHAMYPELRSAALRLEFCKRGDDRRHGIRFPFKSRFQESYNGN
jgi:hypothetical protein